MEQHALWEQDVNQEFNSMNIMPLKLDYNRAENEKEAY